MKAGYCQGCPSSAIMARIIPISCSPGPARFASFFACFSVFGMPSPSRRHGCGASQLHRRVGLKPCWCQLARSSHTTQHGQPGNAKVKGGLRKLRFSTSRSIKNTDDKLETAKPNVCQLLPFRVPAKYE